MTGGQVTLAEFASAVINKPSLIMQDDDPTAPVLVLAQIAAIGDAEARSRARRGGKR